MENFGNPSLKSKFQWQSRTIPGDLSSPINYNYGLKSYLIYSNFGCFHIFFCGVFCLRCKMRSVFCAIVWLPKLVVRLSLFWSPTNRDSYPLLGLYILYSCPREYKMQIESFPILKGDFVLPDKIRLTSFLKITEKKF